MYGLALFLVVAAPSFRFVSAHGYVVRAPGTDIRSETLADYISRRESLSTGNLPMAPTLSGSIILLVVSLLLLGGMR